MVAIIRARAAGLTGEYYNDQDFNTLGLARVDGNIDFRWELARPGPGVTEDFTVRWTGTITPPATGRYQFITESDDGVQVSVAGKRIIDNWTNHGPTLDYGGVRLKKGVKYDVEILYYDVAVWATMRFYWRGPGLKGTVSAAPYCTPAYIPDTDPVEGWKLVWGDEFNGSGLVDETKWRYEEGFVRNNESQYYTVRRLENCRQENGNLVITCRKEPQGSQHQYTSASINTEGKANFKYGRYEIRCKIPGGQGVWPAFWSLGSNRPEVDWPKCGEIDIMEYMGRIPNRTIGVIHYSVDGDKRHNEGHSDTQNAPFDDYHLYGMEWDDKEITFFVDDTKFYTTPINVANDNGYNPFKNPHFLLINFALGGISGGPFDPNMLPKQFLIDYVRVYTK